MMPVIVSVLGINGDILLKDVSVSSVSELHQQVLGKLSVAHCQLLTLDGSMVSNWDTLDHEARTAKSVTAVVQGISPLLQMVGLQNGDGTLLVESWPRGLQSIALDIAAQLCQLACSFGRNNQPAIVWAWDGPSPPAFTLELAGARLMPVVLSTPVVHAGARLVLLTRVGGDLKILQEENVMKVLTVQDILAFKRKHELVIKQRIRVGWEKLRAPCVQVEDCLRATSAEIVLLEYSADVVRFELSVSCRFKDAHLAWRGV